MNVNIRRALFVLLLLVAAAPWLTDPSRVNAQDVGGDVAGTDESPADDSAGDDRPGATATPGPAGLSIPTGGSIAIIEIEGPIFYEHQLDSIKRRIDRAVNDGAGLIVFDLDTPGGALTVAIDLSSHIRTLGVPTVAWVDRKALSAGILIGSACDELVMSRASLAGDCAPIVPGQSLAPTERAKALSPLLAEFRANAQDNYSGQAGSDYAMFHAMCVLGIEVYQVRHDTTGEVRLVNQADYEVMVNGASPIDAAQIGGGNGPNSGSALAPPEDETENLRPSVYVATNADMGRWSLIKQVHDGRTLLTVNETEALSIGLSEATLSSEAELVNHYGGANIRRYEETWSESLVGFLVHPVVRAALLLLGVIGLLMEYFSPGLLIPGIVGVAALVTLIGAPFLVGLAQTWHLVMIVLGVGLVVYELFTMTTFGILAVLGLLMFLTGLVLSGVQSATNGLPAPGSGQQIVIVSMSFVGAIVLTVPLLFLMTRYFGSLPLLNKLVLNEHQTALNTAGLSGALPYAHVTGDEAVGGGAVRPGMTGVVSRTGLRPTGRAEFDDQLLDVTSPGGWVEPGTAVRVVEVHGNLIYVEPVEDGSA